MNREWYKDTAFYQIWPRSFKDGNGDGIGDLWGVYEKLEYIQSLGVGGIWFSPLYVSPNADFGYDISDYCAINPEYGDLEIFDQVLQKAHTLGLKVVMDLVINHTSIEHEWFQKSRRGIEPYTNYYIWRAAKPDGGKPNNWQGIFESECWRWDDVAGKYYLHLFSSGQPDLNMDNPLVRAEVERIMRFWLDRGVDGFREDVITFISKTEGLPDDGFVIGLRGMKFYESGPRIHEYLQQYRRILERYPDRFVVGEAPMMTPQKALEFVSGEQRDLDMMFHFQHMEADCFLIEYLRMPFNLRKLKRAFSNWQKALYGKGWNALYLENHDHPRVISRYGSEKYRVESGKMLACALLFQQGTPFIYQGQEIGMTNIALPHIEDYADCVAQDVYKRCKRMHLPDKAAMALIRPATRDSSRTPVQWSAEQNAGFTEGKPWFYVNQNYPEINVAAAEADPDSLLHFYRKLLRFRAGNDVIRNGTYREYEKHSGKLYVYTREHRGKGILVVCSFTEKPAEFRLPKRLQGTAMTLEFANYPVPDGPEFTARPYEARVYTYETRKRAKK